MTSVCKHCGAEIVWVRMAEAYKLSCEATLKGAHAQRERLMPCNPGLWPYWEMPGGKGRVVTLNGEVLACTYKGSGPATGLGYVPHWATCGKKEQEKADKPAEQLRMY